jgi:small subunit ribosomal protein S7e
MLIQNDKLSSKNRSQISEVTKNLTLALQSIQDKDPNLKKDLEAIKIDNAAEINTSDNGKCFLIQVNESSVSNLRNVFPEIVKKLESQFSRHVVIVPARKRVNGNLYRKYQAKKVPRNKTLTSVYDSLLEDILYPAVVVGKRIRYPKSKSRVFKVQVDNIDRENIEYKLNAIIASYKALTNRELTIEFSA